jgi:hypothetical protein
MPNEITTDSTIRFGMKSLMLATLNVSLFLGACAWAVRGPDMGLAELFDTAAAAIGSGGNAASLWGIAILMPLVFTGGLMAMLIAMLRLWRCPYAAYHLVGFSIAAALSIGWWMLRFGDDQPAGIAARFALPLLCSAVAVFPEVGYRKAPSPYVVLAGVGLVMAGTYIALVVVLLASD